MSGDSLEDVAKLAGFFTAHAVWCLFDGEPLVPLFGFTRSFTSREFTRLEQPSLEDAVAAGQSLLVNPDPSLIAAVLVYDGYVTLPKGRYDALVIQARDYRRPGQSEGFEMVLPYRAKNDPQGFAVHRPKFVDLADSENRSLPLSTAFFHGVNQHREAAPIWRDATDDSV